MRKFLCKVFKFLLDLVTQVVDLVAKTLISIGTAAVEVLSEVASSVGSALLSNPVVLVGLGILAYMFLAPGGEEEKNSRASDGVLNVGGAFNA